MILVNISDMFCNHCKNLLNETYNLHTFLQTYLAAGIFSYILDLHDSFAVLFLYVAPTSLFYDHVCHKSLIALRLI